jgi:enterochelin esterase family protein
MMNIPAEGKAKPMIVVMEDGSISQGMGGGRRGRGGAPGGRGGAGYGAPGGAPAGAPGAAPARAPGGPGALGSPLQDEQRFFTAAPAGAPGGAPAANNQGGSPGRASASFTTQMINDIIPEIDARYRTLADRDHRAIAGLSLGGMQTYQIAQENKDKFAYVGVFSGPFGFPGLNAYAPNPEEFDKTFKAFFISMGSKEGAGSGRQPAQTLKDAGVQHVTYYEAPGTAHEFQTWRKSLHEFAPLLFQN